ncbi:MAG: hypothetical protein A3E79_15925 [Burkholderiales bacterium RIFCSPHIGHO2_12_FULL_61_11]|nr:MAG: hypothetical protein A3E79_15925 [Burkholderiales bacterium RIFCSPHIGHO2_12_FULL_61_11]
MASQTRRDKPSGYCPQGCDPQRRMARQAQCHRARSALTKKVSVIEGKKAGFHAVCKSNQAVNCRFQDYGKPAARHQAAASVLA